MFLEDLKGVLQNVFVFNGENLNLFNVGDRINFLNDNIEKKKIFKETKEIL